MRTFLTLCLFSSSICHAATVLLNANINSTNSLFALDGSFNYSKSCNESRSGTSFSAACSDYVSSPEGEANSSVSVSMNGAVNVLKGQFNMYIDTAQFNDENFSGGSSGYGNFDLTVEGKYLFLGASGSRIIRFPFIDVSAIEGSTSCMMTINGTATECGSEFLVPFGVPVDFKLSASGRAYGSSGNGDHARIYYDLTQVMTDVDGAGFVPVPEPGTYLMTALALGALAARRFARC